MVDLESWKSVSGTVFVPHTETEYERLVAKLDASRRSGR
jgi:hypothetical protein